MSGDASWFDLLGAALGGAFTVKLLDIGYQELKRHSERKRSAKNFVDQHLDPLLKAADELVGKLRSLAERNFVEIRAVDADAGTLESPDFAGLVYLFGRLWAQVELFRRQGLSVALGEDKRGKKLQQFLDCLVSRRVRLVDRITQRAVGELMLHDHPMAGEPIPFIDFVKAYAADETFRRWLRPLVVVLSNMENSDEKQRVLQYWVVLHALIDTLDSRHVVTRNRPSLPRKLTKESWRDLKFRVFGTYLSFVEDPEKYLGPPRRRPQA